MPLPPPKRTLEEGKKEIEETTGSPAASKEICYGSICFIKTLFRLMSDWIWKEFFGVFLFFFLEIRKGVATSHRAVMCG